MEFKIVFIQLLATNNISRNPVATATPRRDVEMDIFFGPQD